MTPKKAAAHFSSIATMLEVAGENEFKARSFANAARVLDRYEGSLEEAVHDADSGALKGIGTQLGATLRQFYENGSSEQFTSLQQELTESFLEILELPGIGAKKARALREEAQISDLDTLEQACRTGSVSSLRGFGSKTVDSLLKAIAVHRERRGKLRIDQAEQIAMLVEKLLDELSIPHLRAGALRRGAELYSSLDFVIDFEDTDTLSDELGSVLGTFTSISETPQGVLYQASKGYQLHCTLSSSEGFEFDCFIASCSAAHLTQLEQRAQRQRTSLKEMATSISAQSQEEFESHIYQALDLCFIPPELREDAPLEDLQQELNSASLVALDDISGVVHAHTTYSDGAHSLRMLANAVKERGFAYLGLSDHSQTAAYAGGLRFDKVLRQHEEIEQLNEELAPFRILKGIESDILSDGSLDYSEKELAHFDFVIASLHSSLNMSRDAMRERLTRAIRNPFTTAIGHITARKLLLREEAEIEMEALLELAAEEGVAFEINANPRRLDLPYRFHQLAKKLGVLMPICPDAHSIEAIDDIAYGVSVARKGGLSRSSIPTAWSAEDAVAFWTKGSRK